MAKKKQVQKKQVQKKQVQKKESHHDYNHNPKPQKNNPNFVQKLALTSGLVVGIICVLVVSPAFQMKTLVVSGADKYTNQEIASAISLRDGDNILLFNQKKAVAQLEKNPYIADATIEKSLPDTVKITIVERKIRGYVPYMGAYLYIDEEGRVLETRETYYEASPEVKGLKFTNFQLGEILIVENPEALDIVLQVSQIVKKYEMLDEVLEIHVHDLNNIKIYMQGVEIILGKTDEIEQKMRIMAEVMKNIPEGDRGMLDLSDLSKPIIFQYLT
ncbi:MAG: FtsQ-type POTRA domain-containing protein [Bacillota bacterium]